MAAAVRTTSTKTPLSQLSALVIKISAAALIFDSESFEIGGWIDYELVLDGGASQRSSWGSFSA